MSDSHQLSRTDNLDSQVDVPTPLKTRKAFRLSDETLRALGKLMNAWNCDMTAAVELAVARTAAWIVGSVPTPHLENQNGSGNYEDYEY